MNTIDELIYYCNEPEPVGALMLTGEWGCGKTHLIENELAVQLKATHIIVRISLFGISSIEVLKESVVRQWAAKCTTIIGKIQDSEKAVKAGRSIFGAATSFIPILKEIKDSILAINPYDYITICPEVEDGREKKKVILVFDDLERTKLDTVAVLGCINEYCENLHFNTIIVTNEERVKETSADTEKTQKEDITYGEIKEKIVCRTLKYNSDFESIIRSIIDNKVWPAEEYKSFLKAKEQMIVTAFETNESIENDKKTEKPHNIRSLKCALQDFYRIYQKLKGAYIPNLDIYFYSFLAYTFAAKNGIVKEGNYGFLFNDEEVKKLYPSFSSSTLLTSGREWILYGRWDESKIDYEIKLIQERLKPKEPKDILRTNRFIELEEEDIQRGFSGLLLDCYNGEFSLNDYVEFIENSYFIRTYELDIPEVIDWDRVISGIEIRLNKCIEGNDDEHLVYKSIPDDFRKAFTTDELKAYDLIDQFRRNETLIFERNRNLYITTAQKDGVAVFSVCKNKRFNIFDKEMAVVTCDCFDKCEQSEKCYFSSYFEGIWQFCDSSRDFKQEETKVGFEELIILLEKLHISYRATGRKITAIHTETFIKAVNKLIEKLDAVINSKKDNLVNVNDEDEISELSIEQVSYIRKQQEKALAVVSDPKDPHYEPDEGKRLTTARKLMREWEHAKDIGNAI